MKTEQRFVRGHHGGFSLEVGKQHCGAPEATTRICPPSLHLNLHSKASHWQQPCANRRLDVVSTVFRVSPILLNSTTQVPRVLRNSKKPFCSAHVEKPAAPPRAPPLNTHDCHQPSAEHDLCPRRVTTGSEQGIRDPGKGPADPDILSQANRPSRRFVLYESVKSEEEARPSAYE